MKILLIQQKKNVNEKNNGLFNAAMAIFDGASVCELVGSFLLHNLSKKYERKNLALYCEDGLAIFKNVSGPGLEKI